MVRKSIFEVVVAMLKNKRISGVTLVELLLSLAILMVIIVPISMLFMQSMMVTAQSTRALIAVTTAQLHMEELIGRRMEDLENQIDIINNRDNRPFEVTAEIVDPPLSYSGLESLVWVRIKIGEPGNAIYELTSLINIEPGGFKNNENSSSEG